MLRASTGAGVPGPAAGRAGARDLPEPAQGETRGAQRGGEAEDLGRAGRQVRPVRLRADGRHLRAGPRGAGEAGLCGQRANSAGAVRRLPQREDLLAGKLGVRRRPRPAHSRALSGRRRGRRGGGRHRRADPGPHRRLTVKLDGSPQQRLQRRPGHAHRGSERGRLHSDPGGEPVEHCAHLQLDARPRAPLRLPLPARHGLQLRGVHVRGRQRLRPIVRQLRGRRGRLEHGQDVLHRAAKRSGEAALRGALPGAGQTAGTVDVYGLQILDATLEAGNTEEEDTAASALLLKHEFLDGGADDVTLATLGKVLLEPTLTTLGNFLVRSNRASASFTVGGFQLEATP